MNKHKAPSAGLLVYRHRDSRLEILLAHPGGPFWARRDFGAWTVPKGELQAGETAETAARREFAEETGFASAGGLRSLGAIRQAGGKLVHGYAVEADWDPANLHSNTFDLEWPPRSGRTMAFPEIDRAAWFSAVDARQKINPAQIPFIDRLMALIGGGQPDV